MQNLSPGIRCIACSFCTPTPPTIGSCSWEPVLCIGSVRPETLLHAFREGIDGILLLGCPENACHFIEGNSACMKRIHLMAPVLEGFGIEAGRLSLLMKRFERSSDVKAAIAAFRQSLTASGVRHGP